MVDVIIPPTIGAAMGFMSCSCVQAMNWKLHGFTSSPAGSGMEAVAVLSAHGEIVTFP